MTDRIAAVRDFWNETPCDGQENYPARALFKYAKDAYLLGMLDRIAAAHQNVLEVGCGQGTDGVTLCKMMRPGSRYTGVDLSEVSLASARAAAQEVAAHLTVQPEFRQENGEHLSFPDNSFDAVLSVGALHHSADTERALAEVRRVLQPGGVAYVLLYRRWSPKLLAAHALRGVQDGLDTILRTDRVLYRAARAIKLHEYQMGTAIYEGFGVPILRSYTHRGLVALFRDFKSVRVGAYGPAIRLTEASRNLQTTTPLGYLWLAEATK
jgi:SAM-dependent methyltransferase